jgi:hypothetical protein
METKPTIDTLEDREKTEEADLRRKFGFLMKIIAVCIGIVALIFLSAAGYKIYLVQIGDKIQGTLVETEGYFGPYLSSGHFEYKGQKYTISQGNYNEDDYDAGPVVVYVNPKKPTSYFIHPPNTNKYRTAIEGSELGALLLLVSFAIRFNTVGLAKLLAAVKTPYPYAKK